MVGDDSERRKTRVNYVDVRIHRSVDSIAVASLARRLDRFEGKTQKTAHDDARLDVQRRARAFLSRDDDRNE